MAFPPNAQAMHGSPAMGPDPVVRTRHRLEPGRITQHCAEMIADQVAHILPAANLR